MYLARNYCVTLNKVALNNQFKMLFPYENSIKNSKDEFKRLSTVEYVESSKRFHLNGKKTDYSKQFAHIYSKRLEQMRPLLNQKAVEKWGE